MIPVPAHIVVFRGVWFERKHLQDTITWLRAELQKRGQEKSWTTKFITERIQALERALAVTML